MTKFDLSTQWHFVYMHVYTYVYMYGAKYTVDLASKLHKIILELLSLMSIIIID